VAIGVVGLFMLITGLAMATGNWQNNVTIEEYLYHQETVQGLGHPTSTSDIRDLDQNANPGSK